MILPFKDYMAKMGAAIEVDLDFSTVFEVMVMKRFQELFSSSSTAHPDFFKTPVFGSCSNVYRYIPKIASNGSEAPNINGPTASPESWPVLMKQIDKLGDVCLKPRDKSASADAILISGAEFKGTLIKLTVGIAAKNYANQSMLIESQLINECNLFDRMFKGTDLSGRKNVLIVCCTQYNQKLARTFNNNLFAVADIGEAYSNIHEIILLDLTTRENRSKFFGVDNHGESEFIELIVNKTKKDLNESTT